jgi:hypothetical protein
VPPLTVEEECIEILRQAARPIASHDRPRFYEKVDELMRGIEVAPGAYARACREAQRSFLVAPQAAVDAPPSPSKQPPRSPYRRRA